MNNELLLLKEYGHIEIHLKDIMDEREMTRNGLARAINVRFEVIDKWYRGHVERMDTDILARICFVLECMPEDVVKYVAPENE